MGEDDVDDVFVTNPAIIQQVIKVNQVGTLTETLELAKRAYGTVSRRSGRLAQAAAIERAARLERLRRVS